MKPASIPRARPASPFAPSIDIPLYMNRIDTPIVERIDPRICIELGNEDLSTVLTTMMAIGVKPYAIPTKVRMLRQGPGRELC